MKSPSSSERTHHYNSSQAESVRPLAEAGVSETINSLAWFKNEPKCLVAGVNNKQLKIIDFRGKRLFFVLLSVHHLTKLLTMFIKFCRSSENCKYNSNQSSIQLSSKSTQ